MKPRIGVILATALAAIAALTGCGSEETPARQPDLGRIQPPPPPSTEAAQHAVDDVKATLDAKTTADRVSILVRAACQVKKEEIPDPQMVVSNGLQGLYKEYVPARERNGTLGDYPDRLEDLRKEKCSNAGPPPGRY